MRGYGDEGRGGGYWGRTRGREGEGGYRTRYDRGMGSPSAWTGGYRSGYQGGMGGYRTGSRPVDMGGDRPWYAGRGGREQRGGGYDQRYRTFDRQTRPGISPIGGNYPAMGGEYRYGGAPRGLRYDRWFSDRTRWF